MKKNILLILLFAICYACKTDTEPTKFKYHKTNKTQQIKKRASVTKLKKEKIINTYNTVIIKDNPLDATENLHVPGNITKNLKTLYNKITLIYPAQADTFHFAPKFSKDGAHIRKVDVFLEDSLIQTLKYDSFFDAIELLDWNFDGFKDFSILESAGATGNYFYHLYLFNPISKHFEQKKGFETWGGFVDIKNKQLVSHYRSGCDHESYEYYKVKNGLPVFDHGKVEDRYGKDKMGNSTYKVTRGKVINNKLVKYVVIEK